MVKLLKALLENCEGRTVNKKHVKELETPLYCNSSISGFSFNSSNSLTLNIFILITSFIE